MLVQRVAQLEHVEKQSAAIREQMAAFKKNYANRLIALRNDHLGNKRVEELEKIVKGLVMKNEEVR